MAFRNPLQSLSVDFANVTGTITAGQLGPGVVTGPAIASSAITADKINANAVTASKIQAGAIDGTTITGAVIQTAAAGTRWTLSSPMFSNEFKGYTGSYTETSPASINVYDALMSHYLELNILGPATAASGYPSIWMSARSDYARRSISFSADVMDLGAATVNISGKITGQPFSVTGSAVVTPNGSGMVSIYFPVTFAAAPTVVPSCGAAPIFLTAMGDTAAGGFTVYLYSPAGAALTGGSRRVNWTATGILA